MHEVVTLVDVGRRLNQLSEVTFKELGDQTTHLRGTSYIAVIVAILSRPLGCFQPKLARLSIRSIGFREL